VNWLVSKVEGREKVRFRPPTSMHLERHRARQLKGGKERSGTRDGREGRGGKVDLRDSKKKKEPLLEEEKNFRSRSSRQDMDLRRLFGGGRRAFFGPGRGERVLVATSVRAGIAR